MRAQIHVRAFEPRELKMHVVVARTMSRRLQAVMSNEIYLSNSSPLLVLALISFFAATFETVTSIALESIASKLQLSRIFSFHSLLCLFRARRVCPLMTRV